MTVFCNACMGQIELGHEVWVDQGGYDVCGACAGKFLAILEEHGWKPRTANAEPTAEPNPPEAKA
jgi:hypothetical protein